MMSEKHHLPKSLVILVSHIFIIAAIFNPVNCISQGLDFRFTSPNNGAKYIMPGSNIILAPELGSQIPQLNDLQINVTGSISGKINGTTKFAGSKSIIIFNPERDFSPGEEVEVLVTDQSNGENAYRSFSFQVTERVIDISLRPHVLDKINDNRPGVEEKGFTRKSQSNHHLNIDGLPDDFPVIEILESEHPPQSGYYFMTPMQGWAFPDARAYIVIFDRFGTPIFYRKNASANNDLQLQQPGILSYFNGYPDFCFHLIDAKYDIIDSYTAQNGYLIPDHHDFKLMDNGHAFILIADAQLVGMDTVVPGGYPEATVIGFVIQELDENKEVVFQWRSWDHFQITDATEYEDLTDSIVDYVHGNSIEIVDDNSFIISCRNMCEITKINRHTGDIIWRLGGENNMFTFLNDTLGFSYQHDARIISNGNLTMFDNGSHHTLDERFSSVPEYHLDEVNMTATLINRLRNEPDILGLIMGNAQEKEDGRTVVGWGSGVPGITEFLSDGTKALEVYFDAFNYRAYRYDWEPEAITFSVDSLDLGKAQPGTEVSADLNIHNNTDQQMEINHWESHSDNFYPATDMLPLPVAAHSAATLTIHFLPDSVGTFSDLITLCNDIETEDLTRRIANQVQVYGQGRENADINEQENESIYIYPNPSLTGIFQISGENIDSQTKVRIYNQDGTFIKTVTLQNNMKINLQNLPAGIYYLCITQRDLLSCHKIIHL